MTEKIFSIDGMSCNSCATHVENKVKELKGIDSVIVKLDQNSMTVIYDEKITNERDIENAVKEAGYSIDL